MGRLAAHAQEVCGLKWSPDGKFLASGGNDNLLHVWKAMEGSFCTQDTPFHTFTDHQAAVKVQKVTKTSVIVYSAFQNYMRFFSSKKYFLLLSDSNLIFLISQKNYHYPSLNVGHNSSHSVFLYDK